MNRIRLVYQVVFSKKSGASPCLGCHLAPSTTKHCTKCMPFLQHIYNFERINEAAVQQMLIISSGTCTSDWRSHRVECQHVHGRINPSQRVTNSWHSTMKRSWSAGDASPTYTPTNVNKWTYLIQVYLYVYTCIYIHYIAVPTATIKTNSFRLLPDKESILIVLEGWGQAAEWGRGVFSAREKSWLRSS